MKKLRGFEILPEYQEQVDAILAQETEIESYEPRRATDGSAGYDFRSLKDLVIQPGECKLIPTGITSYMQSDEELQLRCRSGIAKKMVIMANGVGTIDSDYYGNHIQFMYLNLGSEPFTITAGDRIGQGVFSKYLVEDNDNPVTKERTGGFGSSGIK